MIPASVSCDPVQLTISPKATTVDFASVPLL